MIKLKDVFIVATQGIYQEIVIMDMEIEGFQIPEEEEGEEEDTTQERFMTTDDLITVTSKHCLIQHTYTTSSKLMLISSGKYNFK